MDKPEPGGGLTESLADFVHSQPIVAAIAAAVLLVLVLLLLRKAFNIALIVVAIIAVAGGVLVYVAGPDKAGEYLEDLRERGEEVLDRLPGQVGQ